MGEDTFCPRKTLRGAENFYTFLIREGALRAAKNCFLSTEEHGELLHLFDPRRGAKGREELLFGRGGRGELLHLFVHGGHGGTRRTSTPFCPRRATKGREEHQGPPGSQLGECADQPHFAPANRCSAKRRLARGVEGPGVTVDDRSGEFCGLQAAGPGFWRRRRPVAVAPDAGEGSGGRRGRSGAGGRWVDSPGGYQFR